MTSALSPPGIVVVGSYNQDVVLSVARLPAPGETCLALKRTDVTGGKGANQAIQAARCGASVAMVAAVGRDSAGDAAMAVFARDGVDASKDARIDESATGMGLILIDRQGENSIVVDSGANAALDDTHVEAAADMIATARLVIAQLETSTTATRRAFEIARAAGAPTLLNAAPAPDGPLEDDLLALTDILVVNEGEGERLAARGELDDIGPYLLERIEKAVIVTLGPGRRSAGPSTRWPWSTPPAPATPSSAPSRRATPRPATWWRPCPGALQAAPWPARRSARRRAFRAESRSLRWRGVSRRPVRVESVNLLPSSRPQRSGEPG
jgi:ribokinase